MSLPFYVADAFVVGKGDGFSGNPAGVCFLEYDDDLTDKGKQDIAAEVNQPITAFVSNGWTKGAGNPVPNRWCIRWFTSIMEYPLCGHASLATSKVIFTHLFKKTGEAQSTIEFDTRTRGILAATITWATGLITLSFPVIPTVALSRADHPWLTDIISNSLGPKVPLEAVEDIQYSASTSILLFILKNTDSTVETAQALVRNLQPNFTEITEPKTGSFVMKPLMVVVSVRSGQDSAGEGPNFYTRVFCPSIGYNEDSACGSAHILLTPYWTPRILPNSADNSALHGQQLSPRGADFYCKLANDRVQISGRVRIALKGEVNRL